MKFTTRQLALSAVFAAVIAFFSVITVPVGEVPVTLGLFGVMLTAVILGPKLSVISTLVYIMLGAAGLPVFAGFKGGFQVIAGPTGGYISSYVFVAMTIGAFSRISGKGAARTAWCTAGSVIAIAICYTLGTLQFVAVTGSAPAAALLKCVVPFVPFDAAKAVCASVLGNLVLRRLKLSGVYVK